LAVCYPLLAIRYRLQAFLGEDASGFFGRRCFRLFGKGASGFLGKELRAGKRLLAANLLIDYAA
jgi:hypothetical protein